MSLPAIGAALGHRNGESTVVYLRLAIDDLRDVGLDVPKGGSAAVLERRHWKQRLVPAWGEYLGDAPLAMAFPDRLVDGAVILKLRGWSYRAARARTLPADQQEETPSK